MSLANYLHGHQGGVVFPGSPTLDTDRLPGRRSLLGIALLQFLTPGVERRLRDPLLSAERTCTRVRLPLLLHHRPPEPFLLNRPLRSRHRHAPKFEENKSSITQQARCSSRYAHLSRAYRGMDLGPFAAASSVVLWRDTSESYDRENVCVRSSFGLCGMCLGSSPVDGATWHAFPHS